MDKRTRAMLAVCQACFDGNWAAMLEFARHYDPNVRDREVKLGRRFREIIGTRNRTDFWRSVTKCGKPDPSGEEVVEGDSLQGIQRALRLCMEHVPVKIAVNGKIIGILNPLAR